MLKIRLTRRGKKNKAFFRLVVAEHTSPIKGRFLEALGFWDPHSKEKNFKEERIKHWLQKGAQCSDTVHNLLIGAKVIAGTKRAVKLKKKAQEEKKEESAKTAEAKPEEKGEEQSKEAEKPETKEAPAKEEKIEEKSGGEGTQENKKEAEAVETAK